MTLLCFLRRVAMVVAKFMSYVGGKLIYSDGHEWETPYSLLMAKIPNQINR